MFPTSDATADEFCPFEHAHVFGSRREGHAERCGEFTQIALAGGELPDDRAARGVGQSVKHEVQPGGPIQNHMVYYTNWFHDATAE